MTLEYLLSVRHIFAFYPPSASRLNRMIDNWADACRKARAFDLGMQLTAPLRVELKNNGIRGYYASQNN
jgi:hypothetical protein